MRRPLILLAVLLIPAAAPAQFARAPASPPLCRVEATYRPLSRLSAFGTLLVRLVPGCEGTARVMLGSYGGPGSRVTGPTETLSPARPAVTWAAQPRWRTVLWLARSGRAWPVPIRR